MRPSNGDLDDETDRRGIVLITKGRIPISGLSKAKAALDAAGDTIGGSGVVPGRLYQDLQRTLLNGWGELRSPIEHSEAAVNRIWFPVGELDHVLALSSGGTNDRDNLVGRCKRHHLIKTARDMGHRVKPAKGCDAHGWPTEPGHSWNR